jgi:hypothetical protein
MTLSADVVVEDLGDGQIEIIFTRTYAEEAGMYVIGSFNGWAEPGTPMELNYDGMWELRIPAGPLDEISYKFFFEGIYYSDPNAPEQVEDGFGGTNGFISVENILIQQKVAAGEISEEEAEELVRKKLYFSTLTYLESETAFDVADGDFSAETSKLNVKSTWIFTGDLISGMPGYLEITFVDGSTTLWERDITTFADGLEALASGLLFTPAFYLSESNRPVLEEFSFGFDTPWVNYYTGYGNSKIPGRESILWETIDGDGVNAQSGYALFELGDALQEIGPVTIEAGLLPNKSKNNFYGLQSWLTVGISMVTADIQYNFQSGTTDEPFYLVSNIPRQDIIAGIGVDLAPVFIGAQVLYPRYLAGGAVEALPIKEKLGAELQAKLELEDLVSLKLGLKYRGGAASQMIMANNDSVLGLEETMTGYLNVEATIGSFSPRLDAGAVLATVDTSTSNIALTFSPGLGYTLMDEELTLLHADTYAAMSFDTKPAVSEDAFAVISAGLMLETEAIPLELIESIQADIGLDFTDVDTTFYTLLTETKMFSDISIQAGFGLRNGLADANAFGFVLGASWLTPLESIKTPIVYANFTYNLDPYDSEAGYSYAMAGSIPSGGVSTSDGLAAFRFGINWEY